jgi:hypothetical protein
MPWITKGAVMDTIVIWGIVAVSATVGYFVIVNPAWPGKLRRRLKNRFLCAHPPQLTEWRNGERICTLCGKPVTLWEEPPH